MTFDEYLDGRGAWLPGFARVLCGDRETAEDVLQEVLLRAFGQWKRIGVMEFPDAYLRRMLVNEYLTWRRRSARQILREDVEPAGWVPDPAERSADYAEVRELLAGLPRRQRTAVVLRYYGGLADGEIAAVMGCSSGTVRGHLSRALSSMRVNEVSQSLQDQKG